MKQHRWSGWPGAYCLDCGSDDPMELAIALNWYDPYEDKWHDEGKKIDCERTMTCKASGKKEYDNG